MALVLSYSQKDFPNLEIIRTRTNPLFSSNALGFFEDVLLFVWM